MAENEQSIFVQNLHRIIRVHLYNRHILNIQTHSKYTDIILKIKMYVKTFGIYIYQKSNSNTVWFNFQTYIIFSINLVSFKVTLRSSGTDILYGCHLLLDVCIIYFISCDCIMNNSSLSYPIY